MTQNAEHVKNMSNDVPRHTLLSLSKLSLV